MAKKLPNFTRMKKIQFGIAFLLILTLTYSCNLKKNRNKTTVNTNTSTDIPDKWEPIVMIETTLGEIRVKLYNETPIHQKNFLKLVEDKFYDSLLFHRVIENFMIQGGDPDSRRAADSSLLGEGDVGYTLPSEFNAKRYHKRGALAAAREGDLINPKRESSGCQFYIVQGRMFNDSLLNIQSKRITKFHAYNQIINDPKNKKLVDNYKKFQEKNPDSAKYYTEKLDVLAEQLKTSVPEHKFTPEQKKDYTTIGGAPHLDGSYTVFGEVIQGMDIVDKIAKSPRDKNNRPVMNIRIIRMIELKRI